MLLKNNLVHGSPLRFSGGGVWAALRDNAGRCGWSLAHRRAFGGTASYPAGYALRNAVIGPVALGGNLAARPFDAVGQASGMLVGSGCVLGAAAGGAAVAGAGLGGAPCAGEAAGSAAATWTPHGWPAQLAGAIQIGDPPTPDALALALLDGETVSVGVSVRQALAAMAARLLAEVAAGPVVVLPAPTAPAVTVAWVRCYDEHGQPEADVTLSIKLVTGAGAGLAYDKTLVTMTSDADGLAHAEIPRGAGLGFMARRGSGAWVGFAGVDADTLALPALLGAP